ncbi:type II toxin-antitoxin system HipA family toxin [Haloferula sargassicola]|uniref:HipA-like C-terminal domain-containing protein n=1 Tax=Haloferula sargassicola TaxID=490096 RepID=A0ABP9UW79_9BACT
MTTSKCFVWRWLPGATQPVVAGELQFDDRGRQAFVYGRSYLERPNAEPIYEPELPLRRGRHEPVNGLDHFSCLRDAAPDAWGRKVIENRIFGRGGMDVSRRLTESTYLLESVSDRTGALDFQTSASEYIPRDLDAASMEQLLEAAELLATDRPIPPELEDALRHGTSIGGARPKAAITCEKAKYVAKFSVSNDNFPIVKAEYIAMTLAARLGLNVAGVSLEKAAGKDVLLVERFDRDCTASGWCRRAFVSGLTVLGLDEKWAREATYPDMADQLRLQGSTFKKDATELFSRMVFNVLMGNTDDHARNHSFFVEGATLRLTPAYDITPFPRAGGEAGHGMKITRQSNLSRIRLCLDAATEFGLPEADARGIVETQIRGIIEHFDRLCEETAMGPAAHAQLRRRAVLNPDIFSECEELDPGDW